MALILSRRQPMHNTRWVYGYRQRPIRSNLYYSFKIILAHALRGVNGGGVEGCIPQHFDRGDAMPLILPLAATNLCQSSQYHIQLSVDCHSSCMNGDIWR